MTESELYSQLTDVFRDVFMRDDLELKPELTAKDIAGWDSFKQIEIILMLEQKYDIKFHTRELDGLLNVGDLARTVSAKIDK
ncbi:acyl carrier protein [Acidisoma sp. S159]|uniref:acyl carrier protein n=1 Tax=Acidisoma sp. S159 TaxID=1747225 RepID=UPI00131D6925|nr:acyl carrier protein [Acidisoma sp. S159]